eukprot:g22806.t1
MTKNDTIPHPPRTNRRRLLPKINRLDPFADPPALTESDLETGLLDLALRGFIPKTADLMPAMERGMPCLTQHPAAFYDQAMRQWQPRLEDASEHLAQAREAGLRGQEMPGRPPESEELSAPWAASGVVERGSVAEAYGTFCTELLEAVDVTELQVPALPPAPTQAEIEASAVTQISAHWRGCRQRRRHVSVSFERRPLQNLYLEQRTRHRAARRIQSGWQTCNLRSSTRRELLRREDEQRNHERGMRRVEVHVCSLSIAEHRRSRMDSYQVLQGDVLDYYSKIMQFRGIQNPPGRFQVVVPENMGLKDKFSLTQALLCSPKALKRIARLVSNRLAMLIPEAVTHAEAKLSNTLRLPLIGPSARNMSLLSSKSNGKKLAQLAQLPVGPWAVDIYDEDEFYNSLAGLVVKHPEVRTWLLKIDDERNSRGTAYLDLQKIPQVQNAASAPALLGGASREQLHGTEVRSMLQHLVPKRVVLCNRQVYSDFSHWLAEACRIGCVIQAVPENMISQTSVHFQVAPDGAVEVLGTSEAVTCTPFVRAASWYPHTRGSYQVLHEIGLRLGRSLGAKGLVGFASADRCDRDRPRSYHLDPKPVDPVSLMLGVQPQVGASSASPFACWVVDLDVRLTDEAAMLFPLKFIAQVKAEPSQGLMHLNNEAAQTRELDCLHDLTEETSFG